MAPDPARLRWLGERAVELQRVLQSLWQESELTRWQPGFAGRRSWHTVRSHLLAAAACDAALRQACRLYVPECFYAEERDAIRTRRLAIWQELDGAEAPPRQMLVIAEMKRIQPATGGFEIVFKHVPDQPFSVDDQSYEFMRARYGQELALWGGLDEVRIVAIATCPADDSAHPRLEGVDLMTVSAQWLPVPELSSLERISGPVSDDSRFTASFPPVARNLTRTVL